MFLNLCIRGGVSYPSLVSPFALGSFSYIDLTRFFCIFRPISHLVGISELIVVIFNPIIWAVLIGCIGEKGQVVVAMGNPKITIFMFN